MWPNPPLVTAATASPLHSLLNPGPRLTSIRADSKDRTAGNCQVLFLNLDPITHLKGHSNEASVILDGQRATTLIASGAQVLSISSQFCEDLMLWIQPLGSLFELEGTGGSTIPCLKYVEVNLQIPRIKNYNKDVLALVIPTMTFSKKVLVVVGSKITDQAMGVITKGELTKATMKWKQAHFGAVMSGLLQLPHTSSNGTGWRRRWSISTLRLTLWRWRSSAWMMSWAQSTLHGGLLFPHWVVAVYTAIPVFRGHCMWVHMLAEPTPDPQLPTSVVLTVTYGELHLESSWVPICLWNLSAHSIKIPTMAVVGQGVHLQPPKRDGFRRPWEWPKAEQEQARELLFKWEHLLAYSDLDWGRTALIKHQIKVTDRMLFREHYQHIPSFV